MNIKKITLYWFLYQNTYFKCANRLVFPDTFAIITACNPGGESETANINNQLNCDLLARLKQLEFKYQPLRAGNINFSHIEDSCIVECSFSQALALGRDFNQNAIFWIDNNQLSLVPCLLKGVKQTAMGLFSERLI